MFAVADAAVNERHLEMHETGKVAEGGFHLHGQFAGGLEDQTAGEMLGRFQPGKNGQPEGGGLARPGLGRGNQVMSGQNDGNGP